MGKREEQSLDTLLSFGLSKKEAGVYIALLGHGRGTVSQISRKAGINRTTGYDILASLARAGLVRVSGKEPKQEYVAESPDNLLKLLNRRLRETEESIHKAKDFIPELKSLHKIDDRPQVKFYEGIEGMKQVYEDTLTATETIHAYANYDDMHATLGDYFPSYYKRRAAKGVYAIGIVPATPLAKERAAKNTEENRELTLTPLEKFNISPEIDIYDNKTVFVSWREKLGIIIESKEIADAMKNIFTLAQGEAKRLEKEAGLNL
ncbi:helix-turn-helix domain-containing protein [Patescibacteria group bacterium]|nr:helix-turn-helix domain-containing protein [Patescibacteria group bacterium]